MERIIKASSLSGDIKQKGLEIFKRLFEAEAKAHGEKFDEVHLHELGATDCIVDVFGTIIGLDILGIEKVYASPLNLGGGFVKTVHGVLPVPAPATAEILKTKIQDSRLRRVAGATKFKIYSDGTDFELTTPTGAAIIRETASGFGNMPEMIIEKIGVGAGGRDIKDKPNVLRLFIGESKTEACPPIPPSARGGERGVVTVIETNIDDMNPQIYEYVMERLFKAGALDVFLTQLIMKKGRPGIKLTVICGREKLEEISKIILEETTTIGLRFYEAGRKTLNREIKKLDTKLGKVSFKTSKLGDKVMRVTPEYEDCKRIARKTGRPLLEVMRSTSAASLKKGKK
ncbi:MAG: nickel pincer cofactor biosynthesis protein LarC [Nitrospirota bacterium]